MKLTLHATTYDWEFLPIAAAAGTGSVHVAPQAPNDPPVATAQAVTTAEDTAKAITLAATVPTGTA